MLFRSGNTRLLKRSDGRPVVEFGGGTQRDVTAPWNFTVGSAASDWQMLAAETIGGVNKILWRHNTAHFLHTWTTDSNWAWQSSGDVDLFGSLASWNLETQFNVDADGDGIIGAPLTTVEAQGNTRLLKRSDGRPVVEFGGGTQRDVTAPWNFKIGRAHV